MGGENDEVNVCSQMDRTTLAFLPLEGLGALAPDQSEASKRVSGTDVTNQQIDSAVKQDASVSESTPVLSMLDNSHLSNAVQSYSESCLTRLSEPQTRSVYGVANDPVMSEPWVTPAEKSLCVYETQERQTPDKHTSKTAQDIDLKGTGPQTAAPEINKSPSASPNSDTRLHVEEPVSFVKEDTEPTSAPKRSPTKFRQFGVAYLSPQQQLITQKSDFSHEGVPLVPFATSISDTPFKEPCDHQDTSEDINSHVEVTKAKCISEANDLNAISFSADSSSQSTVCIMANTAEAQDEKHIWTSALSEQSNEQNAEMLPNFQITNHQDVSVFTDAQLSRQPYNAEKQITGLDTGYNDESKKYDATLKLDVALKETLDAQCIGSESTAVAQENKSSAPPRVFISEQKSVLPSGFRDFLRSLCTPVCPKSTPRTQGRLLFI